MPTSRRQDIRAFLIDYFNTLENQTTIESCLNAYITSRKMSKTYSLRHNEIKTSTATSSKDRVKIRDQVSQELGVLRQMGVIGRARYGVYVKR